MKLWAGKDLQAQSGPVFVMKALTDMAGVRVGHVSDFDALTGCTAILCEQGAVAGVDIRGSASGTRKPPRSIPAVSPDTSMPWCSPGAAPSDGKPLAACAGTWSIAVSASLPGSPKFPLSGRDLYDLGIGKPGVRPNLSMGEAAAAAATSDAVKEGCVGGGIGATVQDVG